MRFKKILIPSFLLLLSALTSCDGAKTDDVTIIDSEGTSIKLEPTSEKQLVSESLTYFTNLEKEEQKGIGISLELYANIKYDVNTLHLQSTNVFEYVKTNELFNFEQYNSIGAKTDTLDKNFNTTFLVFNQDDNVYTSIKGFNDLVQKEVDSDTYISSTAFKLYVMSILGNYLPNLPQDGTLPSLPSLPTLPSLPQDGTLPILPSFDKEVLDTIVQKLSDINYLVENCKINITNAKKGVVDYNLKVSANTLINLIGEENIDSEILPILKSLSETAIIIDFSLDAKTGLVSNLTIEFSNFVRSIFQLISAKQGTQINPETTVKITCDLNYNPDIKKRDVSSYKEYNPFLGLLG